MLTLFVTLTLESQEARAAADAGIELFGDAAVWEDWLARTPF